MSADQSFDHIEVSWRNPYYVGTTIKLRSSAGVVRLLTTEHLWVAFGIHSEMGHSAGGQATSQMCY